MVILFLHTYLVIKGVKVPPRVISGSITDRNKIPRVTPILGIEQLSGTIVHYTQHKWSPEIQDGGLQTGLQAAILNFWTPLMSSIMNDSTIELLCPENLG